MCKKFFLVLLTVLMVFSTSIGVNAAELNSDGETVSVPVKYTVNNTEFIVRIPAELTPDTQDSEFMVTADRMNLRPDESVIVSITEGCDEDGQVVLTRQGDISDHPATLTTTLTINEEAISTDNNIVGIFKDGNNSTANLLGAVKMSLPVINENTKAGDYVGTIEFKIELRRDTDE